MKWNCWRSAAYLSVFRGTCWRRWSLWLEKSVWLTCAEVPLSYWSELSRGVKVWFWWQVLFLDKKTNQTSRFTRGENWREWAACTDVHRCRMQWRCRGYDNSTYDTQRQRPSAATWRWRVMLLYLVLTFRTWGRLSKKQTRPLLVTPLQVGVSLLTYCKIYFSHLDIYLLWICLCRWGSADTVSWSEPGNWHKLLWESEAARGVNVQFSTRLKHTIQTFAAFIFF